ncbi:MAG TPA: O-phospho-L-seryl-tRNA:Cys-tRNA synthase [Candidatus Bathyarchaeota archaeon]|nr:O-phospho-L-seryl-tRNA:Cys-tRNA synthase [Candidatus Bathyarchaeota archaeon]HEW89767.1 O-phospho-L-seryl-tRNA:Cys-tRNA synthase [Candidatus Bathyarchaeota archaeon]
MGKARRYSSLSREAGKQGLINLNPIQRGGVLTEEARRALSEFGDGYSLCDFCLEGRIDRIRKPPVSDFLADLASFLGMDVVRLTNRSREAMFVILMALRKSRGGSAVVLDANAHYSTYLAAEAAGLKVFEVPNSGYPEFKVELSAYKDAVDEAEEETGEPPVAAILTHVDPHYGNLNDPRPVSRLCRRKGVSFVLNAAYTAGVMPIDGKDLGADAIVSSGHKSWACSGPVGIMALTSELADEVLVPSSRFPKKELFLLGCPVLGAPLATLMASFAHVVERVRNWPGEVRKARWLVEELERIEGTRQLGVKPKEHHLICLETLGFHEVARRHKKKGFFLYRELKARGIVGIRPGMTRRIKLSTYGLSEEELGVVARAFQEIARKHGLSVS